MPSQFIFRKNVEILNFISVPTTKKSVQFNEEVEVQTLPSFTQGENEIDESKIDEVLALIQNADPTGETQPDSQQMLGLEGEICVSAQ